MLKSAFKIFFYCRVLSREGNGVSRSAWVYVVVLLLGILGVLLLVAVGWRKVDCASGIGMAFTCLKVCFRVWSSL